MHDLFDFMPTDRQFVESLAEGAVLLHGNALAYEYELLQDITQIAKVSPFRKMTTPGGHMMSVAMTNCGRAGWVADETGYRYERLDPETGMPWPEMPPVFVSVAVSAERQAGYASFIPDVCLINRYEPGTKPSLHQDKDGGVSTARSCQRRLGYPQHFSSATCDKPIRSGRFSCATAISLSGADPHGFFIMASCHSKMAIMATPAGCATT